MWTIMHLADIHLDDRREAGEQERCLDAIVEELTRRRDAGSPVDLLAVCGDLVDPERGRRQREWERNTWRAFLRACADAGPKVAIIPGNHDRPADIAHFADIDGVHYFDRPTAWSLTNKHGHTLDVYALPYPETRYWLDGTGAGIEPHAQVSGADRITAIERRVRTQLAAWRKRGSADPAVLLYHGAVTGASVRLGQPLATSDEPKLSVEDLDGVADLVLLGHIHFGQELPSVSGPVVYAGSPWPHSFGEEGQANKGPLIWTVQPNGCVASERLALPYIKRVTFELHWRTNEAGRGRLVWMEGTDYHGPDSEPRGAARALVPGSRVRIRIVHPTAASSAIDWRGIEREFLVAGATAAKAVPIPVRNASVKVPELLDRRARTVWEELDAMWAATGTGPAGAERARFRNAVLHLDELALAA